LNAAAAPFQIFQKELADPAKVTILKEKVPYNRRLIAA
jgi:hypothetical protein